MAIYKERYIGNAHVLYNDDQFAHLTPEQLAERQERIRKNISNIIYTALEKKALQEEQ